MAELFLKLFSERLVSVMKDRGFYQLQLAKVMGVSNTSVFGWVNAESLPTPEKIVRLSAILQVHTDWLLWGEEPRDLAPEQAVIMTKTTRPLTDADRIEAAASWLYSIESLPSSQKKHLTEFLRSAIECWEDAEIALDLFDKLQRRRKP